MAVGRCSHSIPATTTSCPAADIVGHSRDDGDVNNPSPTPTLSPPLSPPAPSLTCHSSVNVSATGSFRLPVRMLQADAGVMENEEGRTELKPDKNPSIKLNPNAVSPRRFVNYVTSKKPIPPLLFIPIFAHYHSSSSSSIYSSSPSLAAFLGSPVSHFPPILSSFYSPSREKVDGILRAGSGVN
ncbi:unnamed protein product [Schistocephalus solidus]|uniref:Uncharacterized protein n=1 Tax=Schistocephalus solidus TaxID=70667 RepID=A0A183S9V6_SCHSO|nr:unnamed protein product [Schistocephalus solidus]